jgi:hypothetical protein
LLSEMVRQRAFYEVVGYFLGRSCTDKAEDQRIHHENTEQSFFEANYLMNSYKP